MFLILGLVRIGTCKVQPFPLPLLSLQQEVLLDQCQQMSHQSLWTWKPKVISTDPKNQNMASAQRWVFNLSHLICSPGSIKRSCDSSSPSGRYSHTHTDSASSYLFRGFVIRHQIFRIYSFLRNIIWVLCFPWAWSRFAKVFFSLCPIIRYHRWQYLDGCCKASAWMRMSSKKPKDTVTPSLREEGSVWIQIDFFIVTVYKAPATAFDLASDHLVLLRSEHKQPESDLNFS